jgi:hypothetical protein
MATPVEKLAAANNLYSFAGPALTIIAFCFRGKKSCGTWLENGSIRIIILHQAFATACVIV